VLRPLLADTATQLPRLAAVMERYWNLAIAPHWDAIRTVLEADILHRARRLTASGGIEAFADLHPRVRFEGESLRVEHAYDASVDLDGRGLLLVPAAFVWPRVSAMIDPPWQPALIYPPRGVATLWEPAPNFHALGALLGRMRACILRELDAPISTTGLARRLDASPAGVSAHLKVLRRAGLAAPQRAGRSVLYARTAAGDALLRAAGGD
jgi:DNA-binding transcriptional ArsR family regulator